MKGLLTIVLLLLMGALAAAQTKPASATAQTNSASATAQTKPASATVTPPSVITAIEGITAKRFLPDTAFAALSEEDVTLLAKEPIANWGLAQESGNEMIYYNLVIGTRSYQLVIVRLPKASFPTATLLRFTTPKSKPEPIARGSLQPKVEEKPK